MKKQNLRYNRYGIETLTLAVAISVLVHVVLLFIWRTYPISRGYELHPGKGGTVLNARLAKAEDLKTFHVSRAEEMTTGKNSGTGTDTVDTTGGPIPMRASGFPWRRSSAAIEASYGLTATQAQKTALHQERLLRSIQGLQESMLNDLLRMLSILKLIEPCKIMLYSQDKPHLDCQNAADEQMIKTVVSSDLRFPDSGPRSHQILIEVRPGGLIKLE